MNESWRRVLENAANRVHEDGKPITEAPAYELSIPQDLELVAEDPFVRDGKKIINVKLDEGNLLSALGKTHIEKFPQLIGQLRELGMDGVIQTLKDGRRKISFGVGIAALVVIGVAAGRVIYQHNHKQNKPIDRSSFIQ